MFCWREGGTRQILFLSPEIGSWSFSTGGMGLGCTSNLFRPQCIVVIVVTLYVRNPGRALWTVSVINL